MGMELYLFVHDRNIKGPLLSKNFKDEIIFERHLTFKDFLNEEEIKVISPNYIGEITIGKKRSIKEKDKAKFLSKLTNAIKGKGTTENLFDAYLITSYKVKDRERNPKALKDALKKVENQLISKSAALPLVHAVYETQALKNQVDYIMINGVKGNIEGNTYFYDNNVATRNKINIKSYNDDYGKIDFYVDVEPEIRINNKIYYTETITKAKEYEEAFKACYEFLDLAITNKKKVLWEFG